MKKIDFVLVNSLINRLNLSKRLCKYLGINISSLVLIIITITSYNSYSLTNTVVLIKGNLKNDLNESNIGASMEFTDFEGKSVISKANSLDGSFDVVLKPGVAYKITVKGYKLLCSNIIEIPKFDKYTEINKTFIVKKLVNDMIIEEMLLFKPNSIIIEESELSKLKSLKEFTKEHNIFRLKVLISTKDSYFSDSIVYDTSKKGNKKERKMLFSINAENRANQLLNDRIQEIKNILKEYLFLEREIEIVPELIINKIDLIKKNEFINQKANNDISLNLLENNKVNLTFFIKKIIN